ncbi:hypothetical protein H5410_060317, partial [Solanum commersonii]
GLNLALVDLLPNADIDGVLDIFGPTGRRYGGVKKGGKSFNRALFKEHSKCDIVENNMCETFNSWILAARFKLIITMLEEIGVKEMERMTQMREFFEKWITDVENDEHAVICEVKFNGDNGYEIQNPPYKHVVNLKKEVCSCRSWQLKGIPCAHGITAMHYKDLDVESFVDQWYKKATYLKAYSKFIQPMTNMKMWSKSTRPSIEPPEITSMPGRPRKKRSKDSDEPCKKSLERKNGYTTGTARTATSGSGGATNSTTFIGVTGGATHGSGGAITSAASAGVTAGESGGATTKRPVTTPTTCRGATTAATCTDGSGGTATKRLATTSAASGGAITAATSIGGSAANISINFSTTSASGSERSSKVKRGGANPGYKRPRTTDFGVLFGANSSVIERSGTTDRMLHCATLKSSMPTIIDLGYKPNGLKWKGGAAVTQRQLQEQSYKRATQSTPSTQDT